MKKIIIVSLLTIASFGTLALEKNHISEEALLSKLLNIDSKKECSNNIDCKMLKRHLKRDSKTCLIDPALIDDLDLYLLSSKTKRIKGTVSYIGFYKGDYNYTITLNSMNEIEIKAKIYIKNREEFTKDEIEKLKYKLQDAMKAWNERNPLTHLNLKFILELSDVYTADSFAVNLERKWSQGPYFKRWSFLWGREIMAHEFGHFLGLDDEYSNSLFGASTKNCDYESFMCNSLSKKISEYHLYVILRRFFC